MRHFSEGTFLSYFESKLAKLTDLSELINVGMESRGLIMILEMFNVWLGNEKI